VATKIMPVRPGARVVERRGAASAKRLHARMLDLYQVHQPNPVVRDGTLMRGMRALREAGLVGEVGVSNYSHLRWQAADAALGGPVFSNQVRYSLVERSPERDLIPYAAEHGRVVIAYSPLGQGVLSGRYHEGHGSLNLIRSLNPLFLPENIELAADLMAALRAVAAAHDATPAQIALAWVIRQPAVVAIPGASSVAQVESNAAAADIELTDDEYEMLSAASDRFDPIAGARAMPKLVRSRLTAKRR
jgi:aryl-alcohol dehydrogenase-like predicted oxidoreductase